MLKFLLAYMKHYQSEIVDIFSNPTAYPTCTLLQLKHQKYANVTFFENDTEYNLKVQLDLSKEYLDDLDARNLPHYYSL